MTLASPNKPVRVIKVFLMYIVLFFYCLEDWYGMVIYFRGPRGIIEGLEVDGVKVDFIVLCWVREGVREEGREWVVD